MKDNKINWSAKLSSRKFWIAIIGFVTPLLVAFGVSENAATEVAGIIMAGGNLIAYIVGEGFVDASRAKAETTSTIKTIKETTSNLCTGEGDFR